MEQVKRKIQRAAMYAAGGTLTASGKQLALAIAGMILAVIGFVTGELVFTFAGMATVVALGASHWVNADFDWGGCPGPRHLFTSPSGECDVMICHGCESWGIRVRGDFKGYGEGGEALVARLRELSESHARDLPLVATEMSQLATNIEDDIDFDLSQVPEEMAEADREESPVESLLDKITSAAQEGKTLDEALASVGQEDGLRVIPIADGDQFRRFKEWCENQGEEPAIVGEIKAQEVDVVMASDLMEKQGEDDAPGA